MAQQRLKESFNGISILELKGDAGVIKMPVLDIGRQTAEELLKKYPVEMEDILRPSSSEKGLVAVTFYDHKNKIDHFVFNPGEPNSNPYKEAYKNVKVYRRIFILQLPWLVDFERETLEDLTKVLKSKHPTFFNEQIIEAFEGYYKGEVRGFSKEKIAMGLKPYIQWNLIDSSTYEELFSTTDELKRKAYQTLLIEGGMSYDQAEAYLKPLKKEDEIILDKDEVVIKVSYENSQEEKNTLFSQLFDVFGAFAINIAEKNLQREYRNIQNFFEVRGSKISPAVGLEDSLYQVFAKCYDPFSLIAFLAQDRKDFYIFLKDLTFDQYKELRALKEGKCEDGDIEKFRRVNLNQLECLYNIYPHKLKPLTEKEVLKYGNPDPKFDQYRLFDIKVYQEKFDCLLTQLSKMLYTS